MSRQTFEVLILGCSSASPTAERNPSAQLLNIAERHFLIDCGEGTQMQLRRYRAKFQSINHLFISHLHGDHFFGLPGFLSSMHLLGRRQELNIYCPPQLKELIENLLGASETRLSYNINWRFTNNDGLNMVFEDSKVEVFSFPLKHRIYCTGFLFREKKLPRKIDKARLEQLNISFADIMALKAGKDVTSIDGRLIRNEDATFDPLPPRSYAYCSDTIFDLSLVDYIKDVDLLYHEATFLEDNADRALKTFHTTAMQAAEVAKQARAGQLLLGHYSARYPDLQGFLNEARPVFENCMLALDGKKVKI
jgi:ribonuclease Z